MVDTPERTTIESGNVDYGSKLDEVTGKIKSITDSLTNETTTDDDEAKAKGKDLINSFNDTFNDSFRDAVINELKDKPEKISLLKTTIIDSISRLKNKNEGKLPEDYKPLLDFLDKINKYFGTITTVDANHNVVDLSLKSIQLNGIQDSGRSQFFKGIDKKTNGNSILDEAVGRIENQIIKIGEIDSKKFLVGGEKIGELKTLLENIGKVIKHNSVENVQKLQDYIYNNLEEADRDQFKKDNNFDEPTSKFDGKFGVSTLNGLNKVLEKTGKYLDAVTINLNNIEDPNKVDKVEPKGDPVEVEKGEKIVVDNLVKIPAGYKVEIDGSQEIKTDNPGEITVKINVKKLDGTEEQISVNVKVVDNTEVSTVQPTLDTDPCETHDGKKHLVIKNTPNFVQSTKLYGATFYSLANFEGNHEEGQPWSTVESVPDANGDYECLMKMKNAPEVYKVKIDRNGNLCPIIENYSSNKRVLLKNNPSCVAYLQNKIPAGLPGNPKIDWHSGEEDYVIKTTINGKQKIMTIEPMEIDGHGVSPDLSEHLIMMNFVHFLRLNNTIDDIDFNNKDDPDLRLNDRGKLEVRVDRKSNRTYDKDGKVIKNGRWYEVPESPDRFGLGRITENREEKFKNLIKFNNGEHWEDNWDNKDENKYYGKIALEGEAQVLGDVTPHGNDGRIPERTVATDVHPYGAAIEGVGMIRFDETFVTKLGVFEDGEFKFNEGVEKTETDGSKYIEDGEGNKFKKDVENGLGYRKINGYFLLGNFKNGKLDGSGIIIAANGDTYIGKFKDGKIDGNGKRTHQIVDGPCVTLDGTFSDGKFVSGKCILGTESYNTRWDENEGKLLIVNGSETPTGYIDLTNGVVYNLGQERDIQLGEVVVAGNYLRPKNPINFGSESEELLDGKTGGLKGVGAFNGEGVFVFENDIKETTVDGKKTITYGGETYTGVEYTIGKGLSIQPFTGNGYQIGDSGAAKWFFIGEYNAEEKKGTGKRIFENGAVYYGERKDTLENGRGTYTYPNGDKYEGSFVDGQFNGKGTYTWKNGCSYVGNFENDNMTEGLLKLNTGTFKVKKDAKGLVVTEGDSRGKYIDIKKGTVVDASTSPTETVDVQSLDVGQLNSKLAKALSSIPDFKPENISKINISKEGDHMTFVNGVHGVNVNIDGLLLDENIFGGAKIEDRMKLLFLASWQFSNRLNKVDQITFQQNDGSEVMLLHNDNSSSYIDYSKFGLDKNTTEKFFNNYNKLISDFKKEISPEVESSLKKAEELKGKLKDVEVQGKEDGIMMMLMCGKAEDFISKFDGSNINEAFNSVSSDCLDLLKNSGGEDVQNIMKEYIKSGETFIQNLSNYITLNGGNDFVRKYNECKTRDDQLALVNSIVDKYNKTRGEVQIFVYSGEKSFWLMNRGLKE